MLALLIIICGVLLLGLQGDSGIDGIVGERGMMGEPGDDAMKGQKGDIGKLRDE